MRRLSLAGAAGSGSPRSTLLAPGRRVRRMVLLSALAAALGACVTPQSAPEATTMPSRSPSRPPGQPSGLAAEPTGTLTPRPTSTHTPTPEACLQRPGRTVSASYAGAVLAEQLPFLIYLPGCYERAGSHPVLYLLHGYPFDESQWIDLGIVDLADALIAAGATAPFLVVMPRQPEPLFRGSDGGPGSYEQEFIEGLMPAVESEFGAAGGPQQRWLAGLSRGGVWALEIALRNPHAFNGVGALSPALAVNRSAPAYDPFQLVSEQGVAPARVFLSAGTEDWARAETLRFQGALEERGIENRYFEVPGGHESDTWEQGLEALLEYLTGDWSP